jgi:hypothetical protein
MSYEKKNLLKKILGLGFLIILGYILYFKITLEKNKELTKALIYDVKIYHQENKNRPLLFAVGSKTIFYVFEENEREYFGSYTLKYDELLIIDYFKIGDSVNIEFHKNKPSVNKVEILKNK